MSDSPPPLVESDDENWSDDDNSIPEEFCGTEQCKDLFSDQTFKSPQECLNHCKKIHGFDITVLKSRHKMDFYSFIRLVNYIRTEKPSPGLVMSLSCDNLWKSEAFMKPVLQNDPLLMWDIEEEDEAVPEDATNGQEDQLSSLRRELSQMKEKAMALERVVADVDQMKELTRKICSGDINEKQFETNDVASRIRADEDCGYGESYAHFSIHHEMLSDKVRTESYRDAICQNATQVAGKRVLDLGCGTGILSMFCAKAGAEKVVAVDMSDIIYNAQDIVRENGLDKQITLIKGRLEDVDLSEKVPEFKPDFKFDILVSEWMGYFLLYEGMLDSLISARDKYLNPDGIILPNICTMNLVAICDEDRYNQTIDYWKDVYGFKMSCMREPVLTEASVEVAPKSSLISSPVEILKLDLCSCQLKDFAAFESEFSLDILEDGQVTALAGYFDAHFAQMKANRVEFTTGPHGEPTHWKQTLFYLKRKIAVKKGTALTGSISVQRPVKNARSLTVKINLQGSVQTYEMS